jgi:type VI secretion system protein ImpK
MRGADLALRVSSRLAGILRAQVRDVAGRGTTTEIEAYTTAQYVMAALADEIFILDPELPWAGRDAWLEVLLEQKLFHTRDAGQRFFLSADQILRAPERTALHTELASVFLLALQLGFKGRYRGEHGAETLRDYRRQLYNFTRQQSVADPSQPAFLQAYQHLLQEEQEERYAPLSRWFALGRVALLGYLVVSSLVWLALMYPFEKAFGG